MLVELERGDIIYGRCQSDGGQINGIRIVFLAFPHAAIVRVNDDARDLIAFLREFNAERVIGKNDAGDVRGGEQPGWGDEGSRAMPAKETRDTWPVIDIDEVVSFETIMPDEHLTLSQ
ncbi:MAG TPA: hypothetical protein VGT44_08650 [Ktedonobacteraceae bacterium]|nr:hypothetical protein [Ktedonobacteraceae bacterium]